MKGVSPITIGLVVLAIPVLVWLWWTSDEGETPVGAIQRDPAPAGTTEPGDGAGPALRTLPPIETFSAMIDHPLFAATRRPFGVDQYVDSEPMPMETEMAAPPIEDNIADRYRLVGTVQEEGRVTALLAGSNGSFVRVRRGDRLENWTVSAINRQRVLMVSGEAATELTLDRPGAP